MPGGLITHLGPLGGDNSYAYGINAAGVVVGQAFNSAGTYRAFRYSGSGPMEDLGALGGTYSSAEGISSAGIVTGLAYKSGNTARHAFRYAGS